MNIMIFLSGCRLSKIAVFKTLYMIRVSVVFIIVPMLWAFSDSRASLRLPNVTDSKMLILKFYEILVVLPSVREFWKSEVCHLEACTSKPNF